MCCYFLTLDAGLLARSQYSEGPATGHLDTGFSWFLCVYVTVKARRLVNPSFYHSEVVKVRKMLVNDSISGFYQIISVNAGICRHLLVKVRFVWL